MATANQVKMCNCVWVINWCKFGHKLAKTLRITDDNLATNNKTLSEIQKLYSDMNEYHKLSDDIILTVTSQRPGDTFKETGAALARCRRS